MLFYRLFSSFKIDAAMNFLTRQVAPEGYVFFSAQKIPIYLIDNGNSLFCSILF